MGSGSVSANRMLPAAPSTLTLWMLCFPRWRRNDGTGKLMFVVGGASGRWWGGGLDRLSLMLVEPPEETWPLVGFRVMLISMDRRTARNDTYVYLWTCKQFQVALRCYYYYCLFILWIGSCCSAMFAWFSSFDSICAAAGAGPVGRREQTPAAPRLQAGAFRRPQRE